MAKISVGSGIGHAYGFLFRRFFRVLGLSWLAAVFLGAVGFWLLSRLGAEVPHSMGSVNALWFAADAVGLMVATAFFGATIAVPVAREALDLREEAVAAHFVVGRRELLLFFAFLRLYAIVAIAALLVAAAVELALAIGLPPFLERLHSGGAHAAAATFRGIPVAILTGAITGLATTSVMIFLAIRLGFFLMPVAVIEDKPRLARAWTLSRGNFWRIFVTSLALALPVDILARAAEFGLFGPELLRMNAPTAGLMPYAAVVFSWIVAHAAAFSAIGSGALVLLASLFAGASATAYRARLSTERAPVARQEPMAVHDLPYAPAMAAPPLDLSLAAHQDVAAPEPATLHEAIAAATARQNASTETPTDHGASTPDAAAAVTTANSPDAVAASERAAEISPTPEHQVESTEHVAAADYAPYHVAAEPAGETHAPAEPVAPAEDGLPSGDPAPASPAEAEILSERTPEPVAD